ncbi:MAG TPA: dipeptide epimerase [Bacteroidota bacterium]|nr:dipeptide epimerase [Bacteroidota bacterium]
MKLHSYRYDLELKHVFRISRSARTTIPTVLIELDHDGIIGYGEASPNARYGETQETVEAFFSKLDLSRFESPFLIDDIMRYVDSIAEHQTAAKCGIDIALHDWVGKKLGTPLYTLWGLNPARTPLCSFTIGIDTPEIVRRKVMEAADFPILKIKVGTDNDEEMIRTIRSVTDKVIRVDANEGWKDRQMALERILFLQDNNVEFIEQPMPASQIDDIRWLRERVSMPIIADESVIRLTDLPVLAQAYDGINIKLSKCTGIREALRMISTARALQMNVMLGCMIESSVGIAAAAHLSPLVDYADLDGNVLIHNDPFEGVRNIKGVLELGNAPGLGVVKKQ